MRAWTALERGERELLLRYPRPRAISDLADRYGAKAVYAAGEPAEWMNELADRHPEQFALAFDGVRMALAALSALTDAGP